MALSVRYACGGALVPTQISLLILLLSQSLLIFITLPVSRVAQTVKAKQIRKAQENHFKYKQVSKLMFYAQSTSFFVFFYQGKTHFVITVLNDKHHFKYV